MKNNLPLFIGLRYALSKRGGFVSFVSIFSFLAMALGILILITVLSVMNGFDREIKERLLQVAPHATVEHLNGISHWRELEQKLLGTANLAAISPYISGQAMLSFKGRIQGVGLQGVVAKHPAMMRSLGPHLLSGDLHSLQSGHFNVILGSLLANAIGVRTGDSVVLTLPEVSVTPVGIFPRIKRLTVTGIFEVGAQVDNGVAFMHLEDAARLLRMGDSVSGLRLFLNDPFDLAGLSGLGETIPDYRLITWRESMHELFAAIRMEKTVVGLLLSVIIGVAAFNIVASLVLMVNEKRADIAVLRTMGSLPSQVSRIFQVQGGMTGIAGVAVGVILGCMLAINVGDILLVIERALGFSLFDPELYFITRLPSQLLWTDVALVATLGALLSVIATLYPAYRAGKVPPAEALRYG